MVEFNTACDGANQSPINIERTVKAQLEPLKFDGERFELKQFHLHSPSENLIQGKSYPLEIHFVHANADGELAVVGMMFEQGQDSQMLKQMWKRLPKKQGEKVVLKTPQPVNQFR